MCGRLSSPNEVTNREVPNVSSRPLVSHLAVRFTLFLLLLFVGNIIVTITIIIYFLHAELALYVHLG